MIYKKHFINQVAKFMKKNALVPKGTMYLGVSGGVDSMVMLEVLSNIYPNITVIFIDHGTRNEIKEEKDLVYRFSMSLGVKFLEEKLNLTFGTNFENTARDARYQAFFSFLQDNDYLALAHHIDDSFEWSLLQLLKSSNPTLGIPVKRGKIVRPFMSVTKKQIIKYAKRYRIPYMEDSSNSNTRFDRNFIRLTIQNLAKRFPGYLKNYVISNRKKLSKANNFKILLSKNGIILKSSNSPPNFLGLESIITKIIEKLSTKHRGELRKQINALINAANNIKHGPLYFSGGIRAYIYYQEIFFTNRPFTFVKTSLQTFSYSAFQNFLDTHIDGHLLVGSPTKITICPSLKKFATKQIIWLNYTSKLLRYWRLPKNRKKNFSLYIFKVLWKKLSYRDDALVAAKKGIIKNEVSS